MEHNIIEDLSSLAFPVDELETLPGNPRKGNVDAVAKSLEEFGQRKPIVARKTEDGKKIVLAGNTTLKGAQRLGWSHIAVTWVDDDDKRAAAFAIADNRTHDLGEYDDEAIVEMVNLFEDDDALLEASGYDLMEIQDIVDGVDSESWDIGEENDDTIEDDDENDVSTTSTDSDRPAPRPVIQYALIFDDEDQQQRWYSFIRWLKSNYKDKDTVAERLDEYLRGVVD